MSVPIGAATESVQLVTEFVVEQFGEVVVVSNSCTGPGTVTVVSLAERSCKVIDWVFGSMLLTVRLFAAPLVDRLIESENATAR